MVSADPLDQAVLAFEGHDTRERIQELLDRALDATHMQPSPDTYSRAGGVLVGLRKDAARRGLHGVTEMAILEVIGRKTDWPAWASFKTAAAIAAAHLIEKDRSATTS